MKKFIVIVLLIGTIFIQGCYSYRDMNRLSFITLTLIDRGHHNDKVLYSESFVANRGSGQEDSRAVRVLLSSAGKTATEAFYIMQNIVNAPLQFAVSKAMVFTEEIAQEGIGEAIDLLERNQKISNRMFLFIYQGNVDQFINLEMPDEQFLGIHLENMMLFQENQPRILPVRLSDYLNHRLQGCGVSLIPLICIQEESIGDRVDIIGAAILIEDRMVGTITQDEVALYKFLNNDLLAGHLTVPNPGNEDTLVTFHILSSKVKDNIQYNGHEATLTFDVDMDLSLNEVDASLEVLDDEIRDQLTKNAEAEIRIKTKDFFEKFQKKDIDILNVQAHMQRKYPNEDATDILQRTNIEVNATVELKGGQNITNTIENQN